MLVEEAPDIKSGFKIVFTFLENHFFQNTVLEKDIRYLEDGSYEITTIGPQWQPGQVLAQHHLPILIHDILRDTCACPYKSLHYMYMHGSACHASLADTGKLRLQVPCMGTLVPFSFDKVSSFLDSMCMHRRRK